jgi:hemin uptake protein HemP
MTTPKPQPVPTPPPSDAQKIARVTSAQLFAGAVEVQIDHFGAIYRLKQTALGKLILTK